MLFLFSLENLKHNTNLSDVADGGTVPTPVKRYPNAGVR